jgi:hypothetical protein
MAQAPVVGTATCEAERAVYEMTAPDTDEVWRIGLVPARNMASIASDLYLKLTTPQRDYWFTFSVSQGYIPAYPSFPSPTPMRIAAHATCSARPSAPTPMASPIATSWAPCAFSRSTPNSTLRSSLP